METTVQAVQVELTKKDPRHLIPKIASAEKKTIVPQIITNVQHKYKKSPDQRYVVCTTY